METIESDLKLSEVKRRKLCKTFEELHSLASSEWRDLENHVESTENMLQTLFEQLRDRENEIVLKEKELEDKELSLNKVVEEIEVKKQEFEALQLLIEMKCEELEVKEKRYDAIQVAIREKEREYDCIETSISKAVKKLDSLENSVQKKCEGSESSVNECLKEIEVKQKSPDALQKLLENRSNELEIKEREFEKRVNEFNLRQIEFELMRKQIEVNANVLCSKVKIEQVEQAHVSSAHRKSFMADENEHSWLLNQHLKSHDLVCSGILSIFRNASDPASLVLDAIRDICCLQLSGKYTGFDESFVRRSCSLLPSLLTEASPQISPQVREAAVKLAGERKAKMTVTSENSLEFLGFLQFLASYRLQSAIDPNELSSLLCAFGLIRQSLPLCPAICTVDKIADAADSIQNLIQRGEIIHAVRHICTFKLTDKFSPVPLLIEYLEDAENYTALCCNKNISNEAMGKVRDKEMAALRAVEECVKDYNLESEFPSDKISKRIAVLKSYDKIPGLKSPLSQKRKDNCSPLQVLDEPPPQVKTKFPRLAKGTDSRTRTVEGPVKLNFGFAGGEGRGFTSVVARDIKGTVLAIWCRRISHSDTLMGEALAARGALSLASSSGWDTLSLEGNSERVISYLKGSSTPTRSLHNIMSESAALLESFRSATPVLCTREENAMAHNVSQWAARNNVQDGHSWMSVPSNLFYIFG